MPTMMVPASAASSVAKHLGAGLVHPRPHVHEDSLTPLSLLENSLKEQVLSRSGGFYTECQDFYVWLLYGDDHVIENEVVISIC